MKKNKEKSIKINNLLILYFYIDFLFVFFNLVFRGWAFGFSEIMDLRFHGLY